jgi:hypothetical protein
MTDKNEREAGLQPLDAILTQKQLPNSALVEASTEQLTHKQVQKGRKGRKLSLNVQKKILSALNHLEKQQPEGRVYLLSDLFNYVG